MLLSIVIPVYNEKKTILQVLSKIENTHVKDNKGKEIKKQIILVDDFSTDGSREILKRLEKKHDVVFHDKNMGKASAVSSGFKKVKGDIILIQDADLEYHPKDFQVLTNPILAKSSEVVYGTRIHSLKGHLKRKVGIYFIHFIGNLLISILLSVFYLRWITDIETGYKVFTKNALNKILPIESRRFNLEPEITIKFVKAGLKIIEVPIDYFSRDYHDGKKITWKDGVSAVSYIIKSRFV